MSFRSQIYATLIVRLPKHFQPLFTSLEPLLSTLTLATIFSVVVSVIAIGILCYPLLVKWQRDRLMAKQFPKSWLSIIESNLSIYKSLTSEQQKELLGYIQVFLKEKQFIGCLGLQITEEIKVTIAAIACLLLFGDRKTYFPNLRSVLVYLNWKDGHIVILHEFAHQLDQEDGQAEGVPILPRVLDYEVWKQVMSAEYLQLCDRVENGQKTVLDNYGATSPAEFFAVATETFFEKPKQLNQKHEVLYELLQRYYRLDPRQWQN